MNTCKTCKWWGAPGEGHDRANNCENPRSVSFDHIACGKPIKNDWVATEFEDEEGAPIFITGPDFGCIHHEPGVNPNRED